jgi:hypothetical protein
MRFPAYHASPAHVAGIGHSGTSTLHRGMNGIQSINPE